MSWFFMVRMIMWMLCQYISYTEWYRNLPGLLEVLWHGPTSLPYLCGEMCEMDLKGRVFTGEEIGWKVAAKGLW